MIKDHIPTVRKYGAKIVTVDPATKRVEAVTKAGAVVQVSIFNTGPLFRWPVVGENWMIRQENGYWTLDGIYQDPAEEVQLSSLQPGDVFLNAPNGLIILPKGESIHGGYNVKNYGAVGDGVHDDTEAINKAIAEMPKGANGGGRLYFPPGFYLCNGTINCKGLTGITLEGAGGLGLLGLRAGSSPYGATVLLCKDNAQGVDVGETVGLTVRHMSLIAFGSDYSGYLLDFTSPNASPAVNMTLDHVTLSGPRTLHETALLNLTNTVAGNFTKLVTIGGDTGVLGRAVPGHFATTHLFQSCVFEAAAKRLVGNAHQAWKFDACAFEQLYENNIPAGAGGYAETSGCIGQGLTFQSCWFGDSTLVGAHIASSAINLRVSDSLFNGAKDLIKITGETVGLVITNNKMENAINGIVLTQNVLQAQIWGNSFLEVTNPLVGLDKATASMVQGGSGGVSTLVIQ